MQIKFSKYHGAGNDFVVLDNRDNKYKKLTASQIELLCHRHYGIGADGLIKISRIKNADFEMEYFNADGKIGSMCGNGARCSVLFYYLNGAKNKNVIFNAYDGIHEATIHTVKNETAVISVSMTEVDKLLYLKEAMVLNTGSPHYVSFVKNVSEMDVVAQGRAIRNSKPFKREGVNVNFVEIKKDTLHIRTYERGVEDETLACGTGITAAAIAAFHSGMISKTPVKVTAQGGHLTVNFTAGNNQFTDVVLQGPAVKVYSGEFKM